MEKRLTDSEFTEKVFELSEQFNHYVFKHPEILDDIPDQAILVFLDADDPVFNAQNLELANTTPYPADSHPVFISMQRQLRLVEEVIWEADVLSSPENVGQTF
jgi:hypothetical protein